MRPINEVIVHCTATRADWWQGKPTSAKVAEVKRWHVQDRGWSDIGYHFLIDRDGTVAKGRDIAKTGAHVQGHNTGTIGVSLFGGHGSAVSDKFADHFTPAQDTALRKLIADLRKQYPGISKVSGHNQYAAKACPGFNVAKWYAAKPSNAPVTQAEKPEPKTEPQAPEIKLIPILLAAVAAGAASAWAYIQGLFQ